MELPGNPVPQFHVQGDGDVWIDEGYLSCFLGTCLKKGNLLGPLLKIDQPKGQKVGFEQLRYVWAKLNKLLYQLTHRIPLQSRWFWDVSFQESCLRHAAPGQRGCLFCGYPLRLIEMEATRQEPALSLAWQWTAKVKPSKRPKELNRVTGNSQSP